MKRLWEVYTDSEKLDKDSVDKFIKDVEQIKGYNYEQIARYVYQDENGRNTLVECDIPTLENECKSIFITAYEYEGDFEDYSADQEVKCEEFNGDWNSLEAFMRDMAESD